MLDNVIEINLYTCPEARKSNLRHVRSAWA